MDEVVGRMAQAITRAIGSGRCTLACLPAARLPLCSLIASWGLVLAHGLGAGVPCFMVRCDWGWHSRPQSFLPSLPLPLAIETQDMPTLCLAPVVQQRWAAPSWSWSCPLGLMVSGEGREAGQQHEKCSVEGAQWGLHPGSAGREWVGDGVGIGGREEKVETCIKAWK